jgi:hypothetical protein
MLKEKQGENLAQVVVEGIKTTVKEEIDNKKDSLVTKQDVAEVKAHIIKWMFVFGIGQMAASIAMVKLIH